ncbi:MAG: phosphoglucomutase/phosphomannomutase family protein [Chloroflexi bacterium]|nr:phosphoglucomutase/phosphomannomutase family protein [Chloroflexota bacterium]
MPNIKFGTDGFRGITDQDFNEESVRTIAAALAVYLQRKGLATRGVVVGYDRRYKSAEFASVAACVLGNMGIKVYLFDHAVPTPVVSYAIVAYNLGGGAIITASHNPPQWNGFKIKTESGAGAPLQVTDSLEKICCTLNMPPLTMTLEELKYKEVVISADFMIDIYNKHLSELVDLELIKKQNWRIVTNPMHGAGIGYFPHLLQGGQITIEEINNEIDFVFGDVPPEPVEKNLSDQISFMRALPCSVGIALDGDADRLALISEEGEYLGPPQTFSMLAHYMFKHKTINGGLARTVNASIMLEKICRQFAKPLYTVPVGFKHIAAAMTEQGVSIGGEESGSYGFSTHMPERDGILSGLYILEFMAREKKLPSQILEDLYRITGKWYYRRLDITYNPTIRDKIMAKIKTLKPGWIGQEAIIDSDDLDGLKLTLQSGAWLLLRPSGTEPLIRIYAESLLPEQTDELLAYGKQSLGL